MPSGAVCTFFGSQGPDILSGPALNPSSDSEQFLRAQVGRA